MARWTIDLLTSGPPTDELFDPAFTAWELLRTLAERGHQVRGLYPDPLTGNPPPAPPGVAAVPVPSHPSDRGDVEAYLRNARELRSPNADFVMRLPLGAGGSVALSRTPRIPKIASFVRELAIDGVGSRATAPVGIFGRLGQWRDRRVVRRREGAAIRESDLLIVRQKELGDRIATVYGIERAKLAFLLDPVAAPKLTDTRAATRQHLRIPLDVPVVAYAPGPGPNGAADLDLALEAFRRIRVFFPGARFVGVGVPVHTDPGVLILPERDRNSVDTAFVAADVVLVPRTAGTEDPIPLYALRHGKAAIVGDGASVGASSRTKVVRIVRSLDAGDVASDLAELLADPALRRTLGDAAQKFVAPRTYPRTAERLEELLTPLVGQ
ncbi:MAG: glycosyltransferase [Thermoplasmata archaeon]